MASTLAPTITPDRVMSFQIKPGTLPQLLETRAEGGPRLKCFEGSVTLVSPGASHESKRHRLDRLIMIICLELRIEHVALGSTTWALPYSSGDTAYEPDEAYYVQSHGTAKPGQVPDLAVEIVVTNPERKALLAGAFLGIPEMWVLDIPRHRLTFYHLATRGKHKGTYQPQPRSRAFPMLISAEVLERLDDPEAGDTAFCQNCRAWARQVLVPRHRSGNDGV
jgi:Uma2 family endonuclease